MSHNTKYSNKENLNKEQLSEVTGGEGIFSGDIKEIYAKSIPAVVTLPTNTNPKATKPVKPVIPNLASPIFVGGSLGSSFAGGSINNEEI